MGVFLFIFFFFFLILTWEKHWSVASCTHQHRVLTPTRRHMVWLGIEPMTFQFMEWCSNQLSHTGHGHFHFMCSPMWHFSKTSGVPHIKERLFFKKSEKIGDLGTHGWANKSKSALYCICQSFIMSIYLFVKPKLGVDLCFVTFCDVTEFKSESISERCFITCIWFLRVAGYQGGLHPWIMLGTHKSKVDLGG